MINFNELTYRLLEHRLMTAAFRYKDDTLAVPCWTMRLSSSTLAAEGRGGVLVKSSVKE